jgi:crossover junction endodeoxyribonuclease RusA
MCLFTVELPYPIGTNKLWTMYNGRIVVSNAARSWKAKARNLAVKAGCKKLVGELEVHMVLHPKSKINGDASLVRLDVDAPTKIALDALQGFCYEDDYQVVHLTSKIGDPIKNGGLTVTVTTLDK